MSNEYFHLQFHRSRTIVSMEILFVMAQEGYSDASQSYVIRSFLKAHGFYIYHIHLHYFPSRDFSFWSKRLSRDLAFRQLLETCTTTPKSIFKIQSLKSTCLVRLYYKVKSVVQHTTLEYWIYTDLRSFIRHLRHRQHRFQDSNILALNGRGEPA